MQYPEVYNEYGSLRQPLETVEKHIVLGKFIYIFQYNPFLAGYTLNQSFSCFFKIYKISRIFKFLKTDIRVSNVLVEAESFTSMNNLGYFFEIRNKTCQG